MTSARPEEGRTVLVAVQSVDLFDKLQGSTDSEGRTFQERFRARTVSIVLGRLFGASSPYFHTMSMFVTNIAKLSDEEEVLALVRRIHLRLVRPKIVILTPFNWVFLSENLRQIVDKLVQYDPSAGAPVPSELEEYIRQELFTRKTE